MQSERTWLTLRTLAIISVVALLPTILLWIVDSKAGLALLVGLALAWLVFFIVRWSKENPNIALALGGLLALLAVLGLIVGVSALNPQGFGSGDQPPQCSKDLVVTDAALVIDGSSLASGTLLVSGEVNGSKKVEYNVPNPPSSCPPEGEIPLPTLELESHALPVTQRGFTLDETSFSISNLLDHSFTEYDAMRTAGAVVTIELRNFPRGSFYQARGVNLVESSAYLDTETVKWSPPEDEVTFSYIRPGYSFTRPIVDLMYGAQTFDKVAIGALGSLGTLILGTVVEVVVGRFVKKPLEKMLDKKDNKKRAA